jgi:dTDP-glucose 4,6-dehydratase
MTLLVTGGAGFIGSAVVRLAISRGQRVVNLDALTYAACLENVASVADDPLYSFVKADLRDRDALDDVFAKYAPTRILHLAAESHVDRSIDGPAEFMETNVMGTFHLLEAARSHWETKGRPSGFRFHHVSTDEVFGSLGAIGQFTETTPYDPRSPYSSSKAASDHLVRAWHETYGLPVVLTNCSNNYGPYHFPEKLVPIIILNALAGKGLPIYGDGSNVRDWLYVEDHADALLKVLDEGKNGRSYNIGGENEKTNLELVNILCGILDREKPRRDGKPYADQITYVTDRPGHDARYAIDPTRIRTELGWRPSVTVEEGLTKTVRWYLGNEGWWRALQDRNGVGVRLGAGQGDVLLFKKDKV